MGLVVQVNWWRTAAALLVAVATAVGPCARELSATEGTTAGAPVPPNTLIALQRKGCERRCAVYRVIVFADGTAVFEGQHYVRRPGLHRITIGEDGVRRLIAAFERINYLQLAAAYGITDSDPACQAMRSDEPLAITSLISGSSAKSIVHHHACLGPIPDQLTALEDEIDRVVGTRRWIK